MKKTVLIVLALALVACATVAIGQAPGGPPPGGPGGGRGGVPCPAMALAPPPAMMLERADALALTDDQKTKLKDALTRADETLRPLRQKAMEASRALRESLFAASFDASKVAELATAAEKAEAPIIKAEIDTWGQVRAILTAEQVTKLQEMMSRRLGQGRNRRGGGGGAPPGAAPPPGQ